MDNDTDCSLETRTQVQVLQALERGNFTVTDGPAVRIAWDVNRDGVIDTGDIPMGGVYKYDPLKKLPLLVEWKSTVEFGRVTTVDLYVGVHNSGSSTQAVYAPQGHGVRIASDPSSKIARSFYVEFDPLRDPTDWKSDAVMEDGYWLDPTGSLHIEVSSSEGFGGLRLIPIDPAVFLVGQFSGGTICNRHGVWGIVHESYPEEECRSASFLGLSDATRVPDRLLCASLCPH